MARSLVLAGLDGRNPMAYFAALGTLLALARIRPESRPRLAWTTGPLPHPVLMADLSEDDLIQALDEDRQAWAGVPALTGHPSSPGDLKFDAQGQREYLLACRSADDGGRSADLATALVAEGAYAGKGDGKPTDLHFTAGQQRFLSIACELQEKVTAADLREAILGPWTYSQTLPTLKWDVSDDRVYALSASDPSKETKYTVPGADWLALMGLPAFPVRRADKQSRPPGGGGSWKRGTFRWGLWSVPLSADAVGALVASGWTGGKARDDGSGFDLTQLRAGVFRIMAARIRRSDQGGYGSFSPATVDWEAPAPVGAS